MSDDAAEVTARVIESFGRRVTVASADGATLPAELFGKRLTCVCGDEVTIRPPSRSKWRRREGRDSGPASHDVRAHRQSRTHRTARRESFAPCRDRRARAVTDPYITDRYLAGAALAGITGIVVVNKSELPSTAEAEFQAYLSEYEGAGYEVMLSRRTAPTR